MEMKQFKIKYASMNRSIQFILLLLVFTNAKAQTQLEKKVPKQASFVISFYKTFDNHTEYV